jgi:uncharacterized Zn-finger protein
MDHVSKKMKLATSVNETVSQYIPSDAVVSEGQRIQMNRLAQQVAQRVDQILDARRTFACNVCAKTFPQKWGLTRHLRIHSGLRPHACTSCDKSFAQLCALRRHELTHDGSLRYGCPHCDKTFKLQEYMTVHVRKMHT